METTFIISTVGYRKGTRVTNRFREALESGEFVVTCEMIPGRGAFEVNQEEEYQNMKEMYATGRVHGISITDCPSGNAAISSPAVGRRFQKDGIPALVHYTCKDRSRNMMQGELYEMQVDGLENLLVMTGDFQGSGFEGAGRPNFDLDPINTLRLISSMNAGLVVHGRKGDTREKPANFYAGAVVNPFKYREGETMPQYFKLEKKLICGAKFIIQQLGFDARKMQEQLYYAEERGYKVPMIANIFLLTKGAAKLMQKGVIAGCYISDELMKTLEEESAINQEQKGYAKQKRIERAAKMVAIAKGLGYAGVHIGGFGLDADTLTQVLDQAQAYAETWRDCAREISYGKPGGYYVYGAEMGEDGKPTGLNTHSHSGMSEDITGRKVFKWYKTSRFFHKLVLSQKYDDDGNIIAHERFNKTLAKSMEKRDNKKGVARHHSLEHTGKAFIYGCIDCGDCGLEAAIYSCPMASCPKSQRNGPCGGSMDGYCEVFPPTKDKSAHFCIHYMAYHRLKKYNEIYKYTSFITPPNEWSYWQHSAWSNYTHGRDNCSKRIKVDLGLGATPGGLPETSKGPESDEIKGDC